MKWFWKKEEKQLTPEQYAKEASKIVKSINELDRLRDNWLKQGVQQ